MFPFAAEASDAPRALAERLPGAGVRARIGGADTSHETGAGSGAAGRMDTPCALRRGGCAWLHTALLYGGFIFFDGPPRIFLWIHFFVWDLNRFWRLPAFF